MGFLSNLFSKKQNNESVPVTLDLPDSGFILNGIILYQKYISGKNFAAREQCLNFKRMEL